MKPKLQDLKRSNRFIFAAKKKFPAIWPVFQAEDQIRIVCFL